MIIGIASCTSLLHETRYVQHSFNHRYGIKWTYIHRYAEFISSYRKSQCSQSCAYVCLQTNIGLSSGSEGGCQICLPLLQDDCAFAGHQGYHFLPVL